MEKFNNSNYHNGQMIYKNSATSKKLLDKAKIYEKAQ